MEFSLFLFDITSMQMALESSTVTLILDWNEKKEKKKRCDINFVFQN